MMIVVLVLFPLFAESLRFFLPYLFTGVSFYAKDINYFDPNSLWAVKCPARLMLALRVVFCIVPKNQPSLDQLLTQLI